jgi:hypothetical protein
MPRKNPPNLLFHARPESIIPFKINGFISPATPEKIIKSRPIGGAADPFIVLSKTGVYRPVS